MNAEPSSCPRCGGISIGPCVRCLAAAALAPTFDASLSVGGKYWLGDEVGRGGMGRVFRAHERVLDRTVAIKFLHRDDLGGEEERALALQRFEREARAVARLSHPNIVQVYEHGMDEGEPYLAMEWVEGKPLSEHLTGARSTSANTLLKWGVTLASCLAHAHERGVLHRDVKPSNVLLVSEDAPKLIDFGIACSIVPDAAMRSLTRDSQVAGTPGFLAPEALQGVKSDARQDIYALGATLYAFAPLVPNEDPKKVKLLRLLEQAMAPAPGDRPASMEAFGRALRSLQDDSGSLKPSADGADQQAPLSTVSDQVHFWNAAVALLLTATATSGFWAMVMGVTPKVVNAGDLLPLTHFFLESLPDGRVVSRARFETGPWVVFVLATGVSVLAIGLLRAQWRRVKNGSILPRKQFARGLLYTTIAILLLRVVRLLLGTAHSAVTAVATTLIPIAGGALELAMLFFFFASVLDRARCGKKLFGDLRIWLFAFASLLPPTHALFEFIRDWKP